MKRLAKADENCKNSMETAQFVIILCFSCKLNKEIGGNVLHFHLFSLFLQSGYDGIRNIQPSMDKE